MHPDPDRRPTDEEKAAREAAELEAMFGRPSAVPDGASSLLDLPPGPLDMSKDPDRYDPDAPPYVPTAADLPPAYTASLDPARDPDRYRGPGNGRTLSDLLGPEGAHEQQRESYVWVLGLLGVVAFLGLVTLVFSNISPG